MIAWKELGRGGMYDINSRISATWHTVHDVKCITQEILGQPLTYVVCTNEPFYSYQEVMVKL